MRKEHFDEKTIKSANEEIAQKYKLKFEPDDIRYIIVNSDDEILPMVKSIKDIKEKYDEDTKNKLVTRIISTEGILQDI